MKQESLLPGTYAIKQGTLEIQEYRGRWLIRYKTRDNDTWHHQYNTVEEAWPKWLALVNELREAARKHYREHGNDSPTQQFTDSGIEGDADEKP
jgi:hypothetical protein